MLEVVFDNSAKGSMKMAKDYNAANMTNGATSYFYIGEKPSEKEMQEFKEKTEKERSEGKAVGGSSQDVVCIGFALDIGDITCDIDSQIQKDKYANMCFTMPSDKDYIERYFSAQREEYERLLKTARDGGHIRVWKCNMPYIACGFAFLCDALRDIDCKISVIELPEYYMVADDTLRPYSYLGEISPGQLYKFLPFEREVSKNEKHMQSSVWNDLKAENAPLRGLVSGKLISVPEDFYDHIIIRSIPDGEFTMGQLIGAILGKYPLGVGDWWYSMRIKKMIAENKLAVVGNKDKTHPYGKILKKIKINLTSNL